MSQITTGMRAILSSPKIYSLLQILLGAKKERQIFVERYIHPSKGMRILDIGCGPADILEFLPNGVTYVGYDISPAYIERARDRFGDRAQFHCGLMTADEMAKHAPFDLAISIGVLHHMDDAEAIELLELAKSGVKPGGRVLTLDGCYVEKQNPAARFLLDRDRGQNVRWPHEYEALAEQSFESVRGDVVHRLWVPYTLWIMEMTCDAGDRQQNGGGA